MVTQVFEGINNAEAAASAGLCIESCQGGRTLIDNRHHAGAEMDQRTGKPHMDMINGGNGEDMGGFCLMMTMMMIGYISLHAVGRHLGLRANRFVPRNEPDFSFSVLVFLFLFGFIILSDSAQIVLQSSRTRSSPRDAPSGPAQTKL
jgi:hypothetical protein